MIAVGKKKKKMSKFEKCHKCGEAIRGKWDSQVELGLETGELDRESYYQHFIYDKHIRCSPSRAQRIIHPKFPVVIDLSLIHI